MTLTRLTVPQAAALLRVSERTIWRRIRSGELSTERSGRRVFVGGPLEYPMGGHPGRRSAEVTSSYESTPVGRGATAGPWPYTTENLARRDRALRLRREAAVAEMERLAARSRPDPDGLTGVDYIRAERDHPRALDGSGAADRALREMARARRRRRQ